MKKVIPTSILFTCSIFFAYSINAADDNYRFGELDILVLKQAALAKGIAALKQELTDHIFDNGKVLEKIPPIYVSRPNPYIIELTCTKNDNSAISREVFNRIFRGCIQQVGECFYGNQLNEKREIELTEKNSNNVCADRIDYCTYAATRDNSFLGHADVVRVFTEFYHKQSILNALETLQQ